MADPKTPQTIIEALPEYLRQLFMVGGALEEQGLGKKGDDDADLEKTKIQLELVIEAAKKQDATVDTVASEVSDSLGTEKEDGDEDKLLVLENMDAKQFATHVFRQVQLQAILDTWKKGAFNTLIATRKAEIAKDKGCALKFTSTKSIFNNLYKTERSNLPEFLKTNFGVNVNVNVTVDKDKIKNIYAEIQIQNILLKINNELLKELIKNVGTKAIVIGKNDQKPMIDKIKDMSIEKIDQAIIELNELLASPNPDLIELKKQMSELGLEGDNAANAKQIYAEILFNKFKTTLKTEKLQQYFSKDEHKTKIIEKFMTFTTEKAANLFFDEFKVADKRQLRIKLDGLKFDPDDNLFAELQFQRVYDSLSEDDKKREFLATKNDFIDSIEDKKTVKEVEDVLLAQNKKAAATEHFDRFSNALQGQWKTFVNEQKAQWLKLIEALTTVDDKSVDALFATLQQVDTPELLLGQMKKLNLKDATDTVDDAVKKLFAESLYIYLLEITEGHLKTELQKDAQKQKVITKFTTDAGKEDGDNVIKTSTQFALFLATIKKPEKEKEELKQLLTDTLALDDVDDIAAAIFGENQYQKIYDVAPTDSALKEQLADNDTRKAVIAKLRALNDPATVVAPLVTAVNDENKSKAEIKTAMENLGLKHDDDAKLKAIYGSNQFRRVLQEETNGETGLAAFFKRVDNDKDKKNKVIEALGETDDPGGVKPLVDAIEKEDSTKEQIVEAMKKIGFDDETQETIEPIFGDNQLNRIISAEENTALKEHLEKVWADNTKKALVIKKLGEQPDAAHINDLVNKVNNATTIEETATALSFLGLTFDLSQDKDKNTVAKIFAHAQHARLLKEHEDDTILNEQLKDGNAKNNFVKKIVELALKDKDFSLFGSSNVNSLITHLQDAKDEETTKDAMGAIGLEVTDDKVKELSAENIALQLVNQAKVAEHDMLADRLKKQIKAVRTKITEANPVYDTNARTTLGEILDPNSKPNKETFKKNMGELGLETTNDTDVDPLYGEALYEGILQDATRNPVLIKQLRAANKADVIEELGKKNEYEDARLLLGAIEQAGTLDDIKIAMEELKLLVDGNKPAELLAQNQFPTLLKEVDALKRENFYGDDGEPIYDDIDESRVNIPGLKRISNSINPLYESIYDHLTPDQKKELKQKLIQKQESYFIEDIKKVISDDLVYPLDSHQVLLKMLQALKPEKLREFKKKPETLYSLIKANDEFEILQAIRDCGLKTTDFKDATAIHDIAEPFKDKLVLENKQHAALLRLTNSTLATVLARYSLLSEKELDAARLNPKTKKTLSQAEFELNIDSLLNAKVRSLNALCYKQPPGDEKYITKVLNVFKLESQDATECKSMLESEDIFTKFKDQDTKNKAIVDLLTSTPPPTNGVKALLDVLARIEKKDQSLSDDKIVELIAAAKTAKDHTSFFANPACGCLKDTSVYTNAEKILTQEQFAYIKQQFVRDSLVSKDTQDFNKALNPVQKQLDEIADRYNDKLKAAFMSLDKELNINPLEWINPKFEFKARYYAAESYERFQYLDKLTHDACLELRETISKLKALQASLPKDSAELGQLKTRTFKKNDEDKVLDMAAKLEDNIGIASTRLEAYEQFNLKLRGNPLTAASVMSGLKNDIHKAGKTDGYLGVLEEYKTIKPRDLTALEPNAETGTSGYHMLNLDSSKDKNRTYSEIKKSVDEYCESKKFGQHKGLDQTPLSRFSTNSTDSKKLFENIGAIKEDQPLIRALIFNKPDSEGNQLFGVFYETQGAVKENKIENLKSEVTQSVTITVTHYPQDKKTEYNNDEQGKKLKDQDSRRKTIKTAQVDFATDIALNLLIQNGKAPCKDHPLLLEGVNSELVGLVWTALKEFGKKLAEVDSDFGFSTDALLVHRDCDFDPKTQTNVLGLYKDESSYYARFFSHESGSGVEFKETLDKIKNEFKDLKKEKKLQKMDDKEMTQFFKKALGEVKEGKNSPRDGIEDLDNKHGKGP